MLKNRDSHAESSFPSKISICNNNNNCNICQPPYSLISIKETKLEDILQVLSKAALTLKNLV